MKISDAFPSKYLKPHDLPDDGLVQVTIEKIMLEEVGKDKDTRPIIYFEEHNKGLICNITNARIIERIFHSEDFDDWIGKTIELYVTETTNPQGEIVDTIRVKYRAANRPIKPVPGKPSPATKRAATPVTHHDDDDEIPF